MRHRLVLFVIVSIVAVGERSAGEMVATLTLDGLSYVSFQDEEVIPLTSGTIRFRFGEVLADGSVPFTIAPEDVALPEALLSEGGSLTYAIASAVSGVMRATLTGRMLTFTAIVDATFTEGDHRGTLRYAVPFTTETVSATSRSGTEHVEATGTRAVEGAWYARIVGAAVNGANAVPRPGAATYAVLSGRFDQLP